MDIFIEKMKVEDSRDFLEYSKKIGSETDNLSFGSEGIRCTVEEEIKILEQFQENPKNSMFVARYKGNMVGHSSFSSFSRRSSHIATIGLSVLKDYWGNSIATSLLQTMIDFAKLSDINVITLEVRVDNERAIKLYERFGFEKIGLFKKFFKINDEYFDVYIMNLYL